MADTPNPAITEWVPIWNLGVPGVVTAHAPTHGTGGSDPITDLNANVLTSGILPPARFNSRTVWNPTVTTLEGTAIGGTVTAYFLVIGPILFWSIYHLNYTIPVATATIRYSLPPGFPPAIGTENALVRLYVPTIGESVGATQFNGGLEVFRINPSGNFPAGVGNMMGNSFYAVL